MTSIQQLSKTYASGHLALQSIDLEIRKGEIFALLGPNGAGKTTLISIICGIVNPGGGRVLVDGHNIITDYRAARSQIGLVPTHQPIACSHAPNPQPSSLKRGARQSEGGEGVKNALPRVFGGFSLARCRRWADFR